MKLGGTENLTQVAEMGVGEEVQVEPAGQVYQFCGSPAERKGGEFSSRLNEHGRM